MKSIVLPSWTNRLLAGFGTVRDRASIVFGRSRVVAMRIGSDAAAIAGWRLNEVAYDGRLFNGAPDSQCVITVTEALKQVSAELKGYIPLQVVLPDAVVAFRVFELDELPKGDRLQRELARWRLASDLGVPEEELSVACQPLGLSDGKHLLLVQGMNRGWRQCLLEAFENSGITPWTMNSAAINRFNYYLNVFKEAPGGPAAMIALDADCWSVLFWDEEYRLRWMRSRWHENTHPTWARDLEIYYGMLVPELERTIVSYVHGAVGRSVGRVFVAGESGAVSCLKKVLDQRLHTSSIPLGIEAAPGESGQDPARQWQQALAQITALSDVAL